MGIERRILSTIHCQNSQITQKPNLGPAADPPLLLPLRIATATTI